MQTSGTITLPLLGEVPVAGLTVAEVKRQADRAPGQDYLVDPQVEVKVKEYQSQFVTVLGEVNSAGTQGPARAARGSSTSWSRPGGFTPRASGEVVITRAGGHRSRAAPRPCACARAAAPSAPQDQVGLELPLRNGDVITRPAEVLCDRGGRGEPPGPLPARGRPHRDRRRSRPAGGLTRFGSSDVKLRRIDAGTGKTDDHRVDLKDVRKGKKPIRRSAERRRSRSRAACSEAVAPLLRPPARRPPRAAIDFRYYARPALARPQLIATAAVVGLGLGLFVGLRCRRRSTAPAAMLQIEPPTPTFMSVHGRAGGRRQLLAERRLLQHAVPGAALERPRREGASSA